MNAVRRLRRFAAVPRKPLSLLERRFAAALLRRFAAVPKKPIKTMCGGSAAVGCVDPPYPLCASRRYWSTPRAREQARDGARQRLTERCIAGGARGGVR
jgi:hypothetical protein